MSFLYKSSMLMLIFFRIMPMMNDLHNYKKIHVALMPKYLFKAFLVQFFVFIPDGLDATFAFH